VTRDPRKNSSPVVWVDTTYIVLLFQEQLLQLVSEERERSQKAVEELIAEERIKLQVLLRLFLSILLPTFWH